jgi:carbon-monoxide dehydrogenase large subunit
VAVDTPIGPAQGIGACVRRKEDRRFLEGRALYVADIAMPRIQEVAFVRSPVAHGRIRAVRKPSGGDVFVRGDMPDLAAIRCKLNLPGFKASDQPPLADGKVRFVGEAIAACIAPTRAAAEDLAGRVEVDIDPLPAIVDAMAARRSHEARVHDGWSDNIVLATASDNGIETAAKAAAVTVRREYRLARQVMNPIEGKAILAHWDSRADQLVVYLSSQIPHMARTAIAEHLGISEARVRVVSPDVGGAFGYKCVLHVEELCVAWLAMKFRSPFRWIEDRREHLIGGANCREHVYGITAYADPRGRLLGIDAEITVDAGAYSVWPFTSCLEATMAAGHLPGPYAFAAYRSRSYTVATNKPSIIPYRGVARTGICFAMELTIDAVARAVGREPWEVRRENLVPATAMPFVNPTGKRYDSGDYPKSLDVAVEAIHVPKVRARQNQRTTRIGVGFASYIEMTAHGTALFAAAGYPFIPGHEQAALRFTPDGALEIRVGVHSHGQGMETSLAQIAAEILGLDMQRISVVLGDTALTPYSTGTYASRSITMAGGAVANASRALASRLSRIAAHLLQCDQSRVALANGRFVGPSGDIAVADVAFAWYRTPDRLPADVDPGGLEVTAGFKPQVDTGQYSYGTHAVVVEVDTDTGEVKLLDYVVVEDCGTRVNPMIVEGQTHGGVVQGIGTALFEEMSYDPSGQPLASTLADYLIPSAVEMPSMRLAHLETPSPHTAFGIKGAGEGGAIPPPAAIINAVNDALRDLSVEFCETPLTPSRLHAAIAASRSRSGRAS